MKRVNYISFTVFVWMDALRRIVASVQLVKIMSSSVITENTAFLQDSYVTRFINVKMGLMRKAVVSSKT